MFTSLRRAAAVGVLLCAFSTAHAQMPETPVPAVQDPGVIVTRQAVTPAGAQTVFNGFVHRVGFAADGQLWALAGGAMYRLDWRENKISLDHKLPGERGMRGLAIDSNGRAAVTHVAQGSQARLTIVDASGTPRDTAMALGQNAVGNPVWADGRVLVPMLFDNQLVVADPAGGEPRRIAVGVAPVAVSASGGLAYVANWGGDAAEASEPSAPTGLEPNADRVRIDSRGVAEPGTVSIVDLAAGTSIATLRVGRHPTALAIDTPRNRLYVANTNDDSISVIDLAARRVIRTLDIKPFARDVDGVAPTSIAVSPDGQTLYVACGGINAVAVYNVARRRIEGLIPTGWYPVSVALDRDARHIGVGTLQGVGSGFRDHNPKNRFVHANRGTAHVIPVPDAAQLASYTAAVVENNRMGFTGASSPAARGKIAAKAVPARAGEPSLIEHVVYIVKENRTYDQIMGDLPRGNGEPSMVMFGEDIAPNHRKLAMDYVLLDNMYTTGGNSANGHQWATQANEVSYTLWPGYQGRSYPFDGTDPLAYSARGFIWDAAIARQKSVAVFGEYAPRASWGDEERLGLLRRWKAGESIPSTWNTTSPIPPLDGVLARDFPAYSMGVPDVVRAQIFLRHLARYEAESRMPNLTIIQLPCDHTMGTRPGSSTPSAMVADNDLALGQIVEALTRSKFWPKMAIFVIEDDSQNGVDHVDGHRTVGLVISPYARRQAVDSTFYSQPSILKTIELQLGLPTLSLFDLIANDMRASFTDTPDLTPYRAVTPKQDLFEVNAPVAELEGPARKAALASAAMRWDVPDAVPSALLNRITWHAIKGWEAAYPTPVTAVFSPFFLDEEGEGEEEDEAAIEEAEALLFGPTP
jgi:YVTN family beta-propeller protein